MLEQREQRNRLKTAERDLGGAGDGARRLLRLRAPGHKPADLLDTKPNLVQAIQREHPTADGLVPDTKQNLEIIRRFVI